MKKYFDKFKDLKSTNKKLYYATICMFVLVGFTFAYVIDQISGGAISRVFITADTSDLLEFKVEPETIEIKPTQFNFTQGGVDLFDTATATARLKANSTDNTAKYTYNVYFQITTNEYIYTTVDKKPEMILQVTNPNGENITVLDGLTYNEALQGFDITNLVDFIVIAENYEITSNSSSSFTEQNWIVTVKFINLDTNQIDNEGKTLEGKILIQREKKSFGDINIAVNNLPEAYGPLAELSCNGSNGVYNQKYNRIEVANTLSNKSFCNLNYIERTEKQYLNDYIIGLDGTIQGVGRLIQKFAILKNSNASYSTSNMNYELVSGPPLVSTDNKYTGTSTGYTYTYAKFTPTKNGYYKMCYEVPGSGTTSYNQLNIYGLNSTSQVISYIYSPYNSTETTTECYEYGYITTDDYIYVGNYCYNQNATVWFESTDEYSKVDTGYRYEGQDPNNYVWFNNELWRIIGVMNEGSHGQHGQSLVKIIRVKTIGDAWNSSNNNDWNTATLKKLLNIEYLNSTNGTNGSNCNKNVKCDYRTTGIKDIYRGMIKEVTWYLGGNSTNDITVDQMYGYERDETSKYSNNLASVDEKVGLMYASDYGYAASELNCSKATKLSSYNNVSCTLNNWLSIGVSEWTITPVNSSSNAFSIDNGSISGDNTSDIKTIQPTLYLESNVYIIDGDGSINNPYIIGM